MAYPASACLASAGFGQWQRKLSSTRTPTHGGQSMKLSDTQLIMLAEAAKRNDGTVVFPDTLKDPDRK